MFDVIMSSKMNETIILIEFVSQLYALTIKARYKIVKLLSNGNNIKNYEKKLNRNHRKKSENIRKKPKLALHNKT